jgi:hypothetical protein
LPPVSVAGANTHTSSGNEITALAQQNEEGSEDEEDSSSTQDGMIPADLSWLTSAFPFNTIGVKTAMDIRSTIMGYLPNANNARKLCELYFRHAAWMHVYVSFTYNTSN